jgi:hypothetical protein
MDKLLLSAEEATEESTTTMGRRPKSRPVAPSPSLIRRSARMECSEVRSGAGLLRPELSRLTIDLHAAINRGVQRRRHPRLACKDGFDNVRRATRGLAPRV